MKTLILIFMVFHTPVVAAQDTARFISVHFLYGSKPKWKHRHTEKKEFGGLHGGHVTIRVNGYDYGFERDKGFHIFPRPGRMKAKFTARPADTVLLAQKGSRTATFRIPVNESQLGLLDTLNKGYCSRLPYDYAFFGMRCAASVREILGQAGLLPYKKRFYYVTRFFYPKRLRKEMFRLAGERGYGVSVCPGRETRRWECD